MAVLEVLDVGRGKVVEGGAEFKIKYRACVYRPFRGEVVDGVVASVNKVSDQESPDGATLRHADRFALLPRWVFSRMLALCNVLFQRM